MDLANKKLDWEVFFLPTKWVLAPLPASAWNENYVKWGACDTSRTLWFTGLQSSLCSSDCYYELINACHWCLLRIINCKAQVVVLYVWLSWFSRSLWILMFFKLLNSFGQFQLNQYRVPAGISTYLILPAPHPLLPKLDHFLEMSNVQFHCI